MASTNAANHSSSKSVLHGGVVKVKIQRVSDAQGVKSLCIKRVSPSSKSTCGIFVAGGSKIDQIVASANESITFIRK